MANQRQLLSALASAFLAGEADADEIVECGGRALGRRWRWLRPIAQRYVDKFVPQARPRRSHVTEFLAHDPGFQRAWTAHAAELRIAQWATGTPQMRPVAAAAGWNIPQIASVRELAEWLRLSEGELEWFADLKGTAARSAEPRLRQRNASEAGAVHGSSP